MKGYSPFKFNLIHPIVIFCLIYQIIGVGCKDDTKSGQEENYCQIDSTAEIVVQLENNMKWRHRWAQWKELDSVSYYIGLNRQSGQLECIDIKSRKPYVLVVYPKEGPLIVSEPHGFYVHNLDSIFIFSQFRLFLMNKEGKIRRYWNINRPELGSLTVRGIDFGELNFANTISNDIPLYYDDDENSLYFGLINIKTDKYDPAFYKHPICGRFNLNDSTFTSLPIYFPEDYQKNIYVLDQPNITFLDDRIIYNFKIYSKFYIFDKESGKITEYDCPSWFTPNIVAPLIAQPGEDRIQAELTNLSMNPEFRAVQYDPFRDCYYRFHYGPYPGNPNEGRRGYLYLCIMNSDLQKISETRMNLEHSYQGAVITPNGLMVSRWSKEEGLGTYTFFKSECE